MKHNKYPTEVICKFIGDIKSVPEFSKLYQENLGIYKVKVKAPDIKHPLLPVKINNTVVFGSGDWTGTYFSEEIKNCEKYGYKFEIKGGYIFESKNLFKDYIKSLNSIKLVRITLLQCT